MNEHNHEHGHDYDHEHDHDHFKNNSVCFVFPFVKNSTAKDTYSQQVKVLILRLIRSYKT